MLQSIENLRAISNMIPGVTLVVPYTTGKLPLVDGWVSAGV